MKNMSPEDMQKQFQQQQSTVTGQREYYYKARFAIHGKRRRCAPFGGNHLSESLGAKSTHS